MFFYVVFLLFTFTLLPCWETRPCLTDVEDPLLGGVLSGVPVLPVLQLLVPVLILAEHHHDNTLEHTDNPMLEFHSKGWLASG